jgi:hypothetical protein
MNIGLSIGAILMPDVEIIHTNSENIKKFGICGYKDIKREGYPEKLNWLENRFSEGLIIKTLYSEKDGTQGMIEYIPGEYCWRPVEAKGYMFIHCLFTGFKRVYKGKGYGSQLVDECEKDAKKNKMVGVAVVTRKGPFMAGKEIFLHKEYVAVDSAPPDFELMVKKFKKRAPDPRFKGNLESKSGKYKKGLTIIRADQCPYTVKNVREMVEVANSKYGIKPKIVNIKDYKGAQNSPCPFGTFGIIYNGRIIAHHPISKTRFQNIMNKELK